MKRRKEHPKKRTKAIVPTDVESPQVTPVAPVDFASIDRVTRAAEGAGWCGQDAFLAALLLHLHGTAPQEAERAFLDAARRIQ
jgi:hypothetical protein